MTEENYDIIGYPRLVRLNPNVPWKTRGNGALSIRVGTGKGKKTKMGEIGDKKIFCYPKKSSENCNDNKIKKIVELVIDKHAKLEDENTNPGFVILQKQPSLETYEKAVREIVSLKEIEQLLKSIGAVYKGYKNCRGLIGATASIAWYPAHDKTYELITYRQKKSWGTERFVDSSSVKKMDKTCSSTFDNYDYKNRHNRLAPNSPCPILYGIRGDNAEELKKAFSIVKSEPNDSWMIFETNQGTDDHLQRESIVNIKPYQSVIMKGMLVKSPHTIKGGHVIFTIGNHSTDTVDCAAYEPTKGFRNIVRELCIGDIVEVYGGVREKPLTINIEKINVEYLTKQVEKIENPVCPNCGKHMKSKGKGQAYKCRICSITSKKPVVKGKKREIHTSFYEVPVCARRHLSKPIKRISNLKK
ncbi:MAG: DUF1743 domain-containing protein [Thermoplasmatales archaeon]|nr:DUF1743 domain-containing protein [Thermoplasmatales archaeon]